MQSFTVAQVAKFTTMREEITQAIRKIWLRPLTEEDIGTLLEFRRRLRSDGETPMHPVQELLTRSILALLHSHDAHKWEKFNGPSELRRNTILYTVAIRNFRLNGHCMDAKQREAVAEQLRQFELSFEGTLVYNIVDTANTGLTFLHELQAEHGDQPASNPTADGYLADDEHSEYDEDDKYLAEVAKEEVTKGEATKESLTSSD